MTTEINPMTTKMNPEVKAEWIKRLREPERKQIKGYLQTNEGQCCLGVLCEIAAEDGVVTVTVGEGSDESGTVLYGDSYHGSTSVLPYTVMDWAGIDGHRGSDVKDNNGRYLTNYNDRGESFEYIADIIESDL